MDIALPTADGNGRNLLLDEPIRIAATDDGAHWSFPAGWLTASAINRITGPIAGRLLNLFIRHSPILIQY